MTDIAKIGFSADTSSLEKAVISLNKLQAAAAGVTTSASTASAEIVAVSVSVARQKEKEAAAVLAALKANNDATTAQVKNAKQALEQARAERLRTEAVLQGVKADENKRKTIEKLAADENKLKGEIERRAMAEKLAAEKSAAGLATLSAAYAKNHLEAAKLYQSQIIPASPVQGSINSMLGIGASPKSARESAGVFANDSLLMRDQMPNRFNTGNIAAQFQDIGVTAAMGMNPLTIALQQGTQLSAILNSMEKPLEGIAIAFKSIINPLSLMAIGIVAVIAALIQFTDWVYVAQNVLYGLASAIENIGPYVLGAVAALALFYSPVIISGIVSLGVTITTASYAVLAAGARMAAAWVIANPITLLAGLVAVGGAIAVWAVNASESFRKFVNQAIGLFVGLWNSIKKIFTIDALKNIMGNMFVSAFNAVYSYTAQFVNKMINMINSLIEKLPESIRGSLSKLSTIAEGDVLTNPFKDKAGQIANDVKNEFQTAMNDVDWVGAIQKNVGGALSSIGNSIRGYADGLGITEDEKKKKSGAEKKDPWQELLDGAERRKKTFEADAAAVGMTALAAAKLRYETDLLNEAQQKGIDMTPDKQKELDVIAEGLARAEIRAQGLREAFDFMKDAGKSFLDDIKQGLIEGASVWETFGNAVTNVLSKILDKMMDIGVDALFSGFSGMSGGNSLIGSLATWITGAPSAAAPTVAKNAKGNAFTNGIYDKPTMFAFASGGSFGVMGEAGPEAVMPLQRGPNGSLGVVNYGSGSQGNVIVNVNNNSNSQASVQQRQTSQGIEIDVMIDEMVSQKLGEQGTMTNRALNIYNSRRLIKR